MCLRYIVEDYKLTRVGLKSTLNEYPHINVVGEAEDAVEEADEATETAEEAVAEAEEKKADAWWAKN